MFWQMMLNKDICRCSCAKQFWLSSMRLNCVLLMPVPQSVIAVRLSLWIPWLAIFPGHSIGLAAKICILMAASKVPNNYGPSGHHLSEAYPPTKWCTNMALGLRHAIIYLPWSWLGSVDLRYIQAHGVNGLPIVGPR